MRELHDSIKHTAKEMTIKENLGFRLRLEKWESIAPIGLVSIGLIQESLDDKGEVLFTSTYNFNMSKEELQTLAHGLTL
jgi:hypothetical protein